MLRARDAGVVVRLKKITDHYRSVFELDWKEGVKPADIDAGLSVLSAADAC